MWLGGAEDGWMYWEVVCVVGEGGWNYENMNGRRMKVVEWLAKKPGETWTKVWGGVNPPIHSHNRDLVMGGATPHNMCVPPSEKLDSMGGDPPITSFDEDRHNAFRMFIS